MKTVAQHLAQSLAQAGVTKVFGLPGGEVVELLDELRLHDIDFVLVKNESSAVFMADAYAQATREPAVCLVTLGPGAANAVLGAAHCYLDRSPVVIITAQKPDSQLVGYTHQVIDLHAIYKPITKATIKVSVENAKTVIDEALTVAMTGRPGPVHLQLAADEAAHAVPDDANSIPAVGYTRPAVAAPFDQDVAAAQSLLSQSQRPLILAGLGVEPQAPYAELKRLVEAIQAPLLTTPKAKGALPSAHPLYAGTIGLARNETNLALVDEADCIVAVGFDVVELVQKWDYSGALIWLAGWENEDPTIPATCTLVGGMAASLSALAVTNIEADEGWGVTRVQALLDTNATDDAEPPAEDRVTPQAALDLIRATAADDAYLSVDVGAHKIYSSGYWPDVVPNHFLVSNGLSSMSFALPAAIGVQLAEPYMQSICLTGDAGLAMNLGELGVVAERNVPVVIVVFNDGAIDLIRSHQRRAGKPIFGTEFVPPNYSAIAAGFGLRSARVGSEDALKQALNEAFSQRASMLIEVMLDPSSYPTTPK